MQRLVYSPSVKVWVKSDSGVVDLSPYVTDCRILRKVNEKSHAEITFRNPKVNDLNGKNRFMWTQHEYTGPDGVTSMRPVFHPMDPITIVFERIAGKPIQVFTGYCDKTPYVQLFPGLAKITASCTLKRLNYTYWDPALPFAQDFMKNYGWQINQQTGQAINQKQATQAEQPTNQNISAVNVNDSSIGNLVYAALNEVGGWDPSNIYIQPLPKNIATVVGKLFDEFTKDNAATNEEVQKLIKDTIGVGGFGNAAASGTSGSGGGNFDVSNYTASAEKPILADDAPQKVKDLLDYCDQINQVKTAYLWGGNHDSNPGSLDKDSTGHYLMDCSGFVSYALTKAGYLTGDALDSNGFGSWGQDKKGKYFTVWTNANHVFIEFYGKNNTSSCIGTNGSKTSSGHAVSWHTHRTNGFNHRSAQGG